MTKKILFAIFLTSFILYLPSLFNFYTNDDFFHLKLAQISSFGDFINFFNPIIAPYGFGFYRPLTTQVFYLISYFFGLSPLSLHIISFLVFFIVIYLIFNLAKKLAQNNKTALVTAFLYATSATHFGHLYFLATFQELGLTTFYLLSVIFFISFLKFYQTRYLILILISFTGGLMSKEFAITLPLIILLICRFHNLFGIKKIIWKKVIPLILSLCIISSGYLVLHIFYYGLAKGDSYFWQFSPRVFNTISWYILWSLNLPEMLVDYVGPGLNINPNLLKYYGNFILPILLLFISFLVSIFFLIIKTASKFTREDINIYIFLIFWFLITILPVAFLPFHKFSYELTLPLFGVTLFLGYLISKTNNTIVVSVVLINYLLISILTNVLSYQTSWITRGGQVAQRVLEFTKNKNQNNGSKKTLFFYDEPEDKKLLWLPSSQLKQILSDNNFFAVFSPDRINAFYLSNEQAFDLVNRENKVVQNATWIRAKNFF